MILDIVMIKVLARPAFMFSLALIILGGVFGQNAQGQGNPYDGQCRVVISNDLVSHWSATRHVFEIWSGHPDCDGGTFVQNAPLGTRFRYADRMTGRNGVVLREIRYVLPGEDIMRTGWMPLGSRRTPFDF